MEHNSNMTLVTSLFDIKRGDLPPGFSRGFDHYIETFRRLLKTELPMTIFCDEDVEKIVWEERGDKRDKTQIVRKTLDDLRAFPFYEQTNRIRQQQDWRNRAGWIVDSPQSQLELYNPLVMSKQFFLNDASIFNYFDTKYFFWLDAGIANTIGDPCEFFTEEHMEKLTRGMNKMTYLAWPYDGQVEVHGFEKQAFNQWAGAETDRCLRGGMFGGPAHAIHEINDIYYRLLEDTLNSGLMGTEESIFTLISYRHPDLVDMLQLEGNGLIITALNKIKNGQQVTKAERLAVYYLVFNKPEQFRQSIATFKEHLPREFDNCKKYVINNTIPLNTDQVALGKHDEGFDYEKVMAQFDELCEEYDCEQIVMGNNVGICGGRQFAAEHFLDTEHEYMIFFEDDMKFHGPNDGLDKCGFGTFYHRVLDIGMEIMQNEDLDYLKLAFSEFYGVNHNNWGYENVPVDNGTRDRLFPPNPDGSKNWNTIVHKTESHRNVPYAVGEYHYCNWPIIFNKRGTQQMFMEDKYAHLYEQTWMSQACQWIREGKLKAGSLLASIVYHERNEHYNGDRRRENDQYTN